MNSHSLALLVLLFPSFHPECNLNKTFDRLYPTVSKLNPYWTGVVQKQPDDAFFISTFKDCHCYLYIGHNNGSKYYSDDKVLSLSTIQPICLLMGCSSVRLGTKEKVVHISTGYYYMVKNCCFMLGCLWDVGDIDIDRITKKILDVFLVGDICEHS